jgi:hypothetical protein
MKRRVLPALAILALLGACAPTLVWHKEGADDEDLRQAQRRCARDAQGYGYALDRGRGDEPMAGERNAGSAGGTVYRDCMERQGWRRYRDQPRS